MSKKFSKLDTWAPFIGFVISLPFGAWMIVAEGYDWWMWLVFAFWSIAGSLIMVWATGVSLNLIYDKVEEYKD